ncbi:MAG: ubiquinone-binding protein [Robiginitomaculum sp.]|nr:MAG: ubiquinone-binding protein [Robiginitomaculum sp.]
MSRHHIFRHMPFSPHDLHDLAWDVEDYPNFIKFISAIRLLKSAKNEMRAEVRVQYKMLRESFVTNITREPDDGEILVSLVSGPFKDLNNRWQFHPLADGSTLVEFMVSYRFSISWLGKLFGSKQSRAEHKVLRAFENRAASRFTEIKTPHEFEHQVRSEIAELKATFKH